MVIDYEKLLRTYMLHVYKWTGDFECGDDFMLFDTFYSKEFNLIKYEILKELELKKLSENIVSNVIIISSEEKNKDEVMIRNKKFNKTNRYGYYELRK